MSARILALSSAASLLLAGVAHAEVHVSYSVIPSYASHPEQQGALQLAKQIAVDNCLKLKGEVAGAPQARITGAFGPGSLPDDIVAVSGYEAEGSVRCKFSEEHGNTEAPE